jgi:hypothetical protein
MRFLTWEHLLTFAHVPPSCRGDGFQNLRSHTALAFKMAERGSKSNFKIVSCLFLLCPESCLEVVGLVDSVRVLCV